MESPLPLLGAPICAKPRFIKYSFVLLDNVSAVSIPAKNGKKSLTKEDFRDNARIVALRTVLVPGTGAYAMVATGVDLTELGFMSAGFKDVLIVADRDSTMTFGG